jgi:hypothetical protein
MEGVRRTAGCASRVAMTNGDRVDFGTVLDAPAKQGPSAETSV